MRPGDGVEIENVYDSPHAFSLTRPHLVYLSGAQPAPVMRDYVAVRREGEALIVARALDANVSAASVLRCAL